MVIFHSYVNVYQRVAGNLGKSGDKYGDIHGYTVSGFDSMKSMGNLRNLGMFDWILGDKSP